MIADGEIEQDAMPAIEADVDLDIDAAVEFADASPIEDISTLERHVYAPTLEEVGS